jgi:myo-inositol-1(or 4)-monophosphatase
MDLKIILEKVKMIALQAGEFIENEALKFKSNAIEYKDVNNVVSYVDKEAETMIIAGLRGIDPKIGFITEEGTAETDDVNGLNWIIDPLDGTANFVHGLPHYSVSLALADGKEVLVGVVYNICTKDIYWATKNGGAFRNGHKMSVSNNETFGQSLFATGFPYYKFEEMDKYIQILESLMQKTHGLRRFGSAALDLAYVAAGMYDGFFEYNLNAWDMAAGVLLVTEAGGKVSDFSGGDNYLFGGDIIAGGPIQTELLGEVKRFWY